MNPNLPQLTQTLRESPGILFAYLYGSHASETPPRPDSDLDLAIYPRTALTAEQRLDLWKTLNLLTDYPIDLVDLRTTTTVLAHQVISTGQLLFTHDETLSQTYYMSTLRDYWDLNISRREILAQRLPTRLHPPDLPHVT